MSMESFNEEAKPVARTVGRPIPVGLEDRPAAEVELALKTLDDLFNSYVEEKKIVNKQFATNGLFIQFSKDIANNAKIFIPAKTVSSYLLDNRGVSFIPSSETESVPVSKPKILHLTGNIKEKKVRTSRAAAIGTSTILRSVKKLAANDDTEDSSLPLFPEE